MTEKIMMDGYPLEVGDRVWCLIYGWVVLDHIVDFKEPRVYPLKFIDENGAYRTYTRWLQNTAGTSRTLYWDEIKITPPPKPKKKVKVWDWFVELRNGKVRKKVAKTETYITHDSNVQIAQKIDGTERMVER